MCCLYCRCRVAWSQTGNKASSLETKKGKKLHCLSVLTFSGLEDKSINVEIEGRDSIYTKLHHNVGPCFMTPFGNCHVTENELAFSDTA